ncbi:hypothetical protein [Nostoc sp.]|uniref:hypothetical protein n=1 Tax=Nostoc sp. TaxID=1180 RepID=UPI002FF9D171
MRTHKFGDWGLGTGDWGLGTGDWGLRENNQCPMPNAQCPMPYDKFKEFFDQSELLALLAWLSR